MLVAALGTKLRRPVTLVIPFTNPEGGALPFIFLWALEKFIILLQITTGDPRAQLFPLLLAVALGQGPLLLLPQAVLLFGPPAPTASLPIFRRSWNYRPESWLHPQAGIARRDLSPVHESLCCHS